MIFFERILLTQLVKGKHNYHVKEILTQLFLRAQGRGKSERRLKMAKGRWNKEPSNGPGTGGTGEQLCMGPTHQQNPHNATNDNLMVLIVIVK